MYLFCVFTHASLRDTHTHPTAAWWCGWGAMPLRYDTLPEAAPYRPQAYMTRMGNHRVPDVPHHRSAYLHSLNVALENACTANGDPPTLRLDDDTPDYAKRAVWQLVYDKVFAYWIRRRNGSRSVTSLPLDHRYMFWQVLARMHYIIHIRSKRFKQAHTYAFLQQRRLHVSKDPVRQFSVQHLWRAIAILLTAWKTLRYSDDVTDYVGALASQCGRYFWIALPDPRVFNHPRFVSRVEDTEGLGVAGGAGACLCVNEEFIVETERIFFGLFSSLEEHDGLIRGADSVEEAPRAVSYEAIIDWLRQGVAIDAVREFVQRDYEETIYERRTLVGEVERFSEKDQHADATPYNAIAKMRPSVIDETAEMLDKETLLGGLIDHLQTWDPNARAGLVAATTSKAVQERADNDSDAAELAVIVAGYRLDDAFVSDHIRFSSWFVCHTTPIPGAKRDYPVLVNACHAWHVAHDNRVWLCANVVDAIECWTRRMCTSLSAFEAIRHVATRRDPFYEAHRAVTGGEVSILEEEDEQRRRASQEDDVLEVPYGYDDEDDMSELGG